MNHDHFQHLLVRRGHDVLFATLNHPETRNALAPGMVAELARVVGWAESDAAVRVPVIAAVEGAAIGGGMGLACACDLVLATADAKFALSETSLGLIPAQIAP